MLQWFHDIIIPNRQMGYHKLQFYDIVSGDFVLKEHEAAKWLTKENLDSVDWLPADQGLVEKIKEEFIKMMHLYSKELQINERNTHYIR